MLVMILEASVVCGTHILPTTTKKKTMSVSNLYGFEHDLFTIVVDVK